MCLPCCIPGCCGPPRQFTAFASTVGLSQHETQGFDDFLKGICAALGCRDRQASGKPTMLAIAHGHVLEAAKAAWPQADPNCLADSIRGITEGVGKAFGSCPDQNAFFAVLFQQIAPSLGKLLGCVLGQARASEVELNAYRAIPGMFSQNANQPWIQCLIQLLMNAMGCRPPAPPQPPAQQPGGCCPPPTQPPGQGWRPATQNRC